MRSDGKCEARNRHRETDEERQTQRNRRGDTDTEKQTEGETDSGRDRHRETDEETQTQRNRRDRETDKERQTQRNRQRNRRGETDSETDTEKQTRRDRHRETDTERQTTRAKVNLKKQTFAQLRTGLINFDTKTRNSGSVHRPPPPPSRGCGRYSGIPHGDHIIWHTGILPHFCRSYSHSEHRFRALTLLQPLPDLVMPLVKGHSLSPRSCPPTRSAPSERFGTYRPSRSEEDRPE